MGQAFDSRLCCKHTRNLYPVTRCLLLASLHPIIRPMGGGRILSCMCRQDKCYCILPLPEQGTAELLASEATSQLTCPSNIFTAPAYCAVPPRPEQQTVSRTLFSCCIAKPARHPANSHALYCLCCCNVPCCHSKSGLPGTLRALLPFHVCCRRVYCQHSFPL